MSRYTRGSASSRDTEIGQLIESFLDDNSEHISQYLWDELETLGREVDMLADEQERRIADQEGLIEDLQQEIEDLQQEILELEEREN